MQSKELLVSALRQSYGLVMPLLEDLKSAPLVAPTLKGGNHAHWILGHLVASEGQFRSMMRGIPDPTESLRPLFGGGSTPDSTGAGYPPYEELLARIVGLRQETMDWLESLGEEELDRASTLVPPGFEPFFGTWRSCLLMQAMHWMNHRGQLADCRRSAGRERMMA
ncbi:MAG: DinB family protein [Planctomycetaceae bacterium]|nr:DinB family protein [Planctomycetaceae bacterium]